MVPSPPLLDGLAQNPFHWVALWNGIVPTLHLTCLLVGEIFPAWIRALAKWLLQTTPPQINEAIAWYKSSKSLLPSAFLEQACIVNFFGIALDMMAVSLTGAAGIEQLQHCIQTIDACNTSYVEVLELNLKELHMKQVINEFGNAGNSYGDIGGRAIGLGVSFKDVVEEYCAENSLFFAPKPGKLLGDGSKQIYSVGDQNGNIHGQVYIDCNVLFFRSMFKNKQKGGKMEQFIDVETSWEPISLDDLKGKISFFSGAL